MNLSPALSLMFSLLLVSLLIGCSSGSQDLPEHIRNLENLTVYAADTLPAYGIRFERETEYGETEEVVLGSLGSVAVDQKSRVYIEDDDRQTIYRYHPDGSYDLSISREGAGPGEFRGINSMKINAGQLYIFDHSLQRINVFTLDPVAFKRTMNIERQQSDEELSGLNPSKIFVRNEHYVLMRFASTGRDGPIRYYPLDSRGKVIPDKILEQKPYTYMEYNLGGRMTISSKLPFNRESLISQSGNGRIYSAWTEDFLVKVYDSDGRYLRAFYYPYNKVKLSRYSLLGEYPEGTMQRIMIRNGDLPETWPALNTIHSDDRNQLWVSTVVEDRKEYQWWVLDNRGELLARFIWPEDRSVEQIRGGHLYTRETHEDTGLQQIVSYRIVMEEHGS